MIVYKLTDENMQTYGGCQWKIGEWKGTDGIGGLCGPGWLHCYSSALLAVLFNPIHSNFISPRLFMAEVKGRGKHDRGLKSGYRNMRLIKEVGLPKITLVQRVSFGILCAKEICSDEGWNRWADKWLGGKNRSNSSAAYAAAADAASAYDAARASVRAVYAVFGKRRIDLQKIAKEAVDNY